MSEANLPLIIPVLATVNSSLTVQNADNQGIARMTYDKKEGILHIEGETQNPTNKQKKKKNQSLKGVTLDGWLFVPDDGFYAEEPHILLQTPFLEGSCTITIVISISSLIMLKF